ncbi:MAG: anthranilate synthase component I [Rhodothermales bacterium]
MTFPEFQDLIAAERAKGTTSFVLPLHKRLSADLQTPVSAFLSLREPGTYSFLLESVEGGEQLARYSFLGKNPYRVVRADGPDVYIQTLRHIDTFGMPDSSGTVFEVMQRLLDAYSEIKLHGLPALACGAVGYMGHDTVRVIERLPNIPEDTLGVPDAVWCFYDTLAAFDHVKHQLVLMASVFINADTDLQAAYDDAQHRLRALEAEFSAVSFSSPEPIRLTQREMASNFERSDFEASVDTMKRYIYEGDIFQGVLSQRFELTFSGDPFNLYRSLRQVNPSPYLFYIDFDAFKLVGSSPEVLVRVEQGIAEILPIAGTRPRGATYEEDQAFEVELLADPKERAEHLMLVDLGRNDLGRVCTYDSVHVKDYAYIERYSHVMHIVSTVAGTLQDDYGAMDVLAASFPAGTLTGAPKVRALEIIDELEPTKRCIYGGAVGYVDFSGTLNTCIAIRTMLVKDDQIFVQAGAGIVADSDPAKEYEETENKARALKQAIRVAADGLL